MKRFVCYQPGRLSSALKDGSFPRVWANHLHAEYCHRPYRLLRCFRRELEHVLETAGSIHHDKALSAEAARASRLTYHLHTRRCCGAGPLTKALVEAGFEVTGLDTSAAFIALARANVRKARFIHASVEDTEIRNYDAVVAVSYTQPPSAKKAA